MFLPNYEDIHKSETHLRAIKSMKLTIKNIHEALYGIKNKSRLNNQSIKITID